MSDSDTFLDNILEGVIVTDDAPPSIRKQALPPDQVPTSIADPALQPRAEGSGTPVTHNVEPPVLTGLDALLDGLPPMSSPNAPTIPAEVSRLQGADGPRAEPLPSPPADTAGNGESVRTTAEAGTTDASARPDGDLGLQPAALPLAAPHHILGLPGEPDVMASHIELALEINGIAEAEPAVMNPQSFASIAQEIADTVDVKAPGPKHNPSGADLTDADRSVYMRSRGHRRRRVNRTTRVAATQILAIVLLLVVGLAAEYEYVARGHSNDSTTLSPVATTLPGVQLRAVAPTPVKGFVFHFATAGSAQSKPFRVASPFVVAVSARCSPSAKPTSVDVVLQAQGRQAANLFVSGKVRGSHDLTSAKLGAGTYVVITRTLGICSWSAGGIARS